MGLSAEVWDKIKGLHVMERAAPDLHSKHRQSILTKAINFKLPRRGRINKSWRGPQGQSNHQRVVIGRAARFGLSVKEYEIKHP